MSDFQKTVDLSSKTNGQKDRSFEAPKKKVLKKKPVNRAEEIDKVFEDNEMHQIERPKKTQSDSDLFKKLSLILFLLLICVSVYFVFFKKEISPQSAEIVESKSGWYAVELMNGETYYGEIKNTTTDPIVIENVYYNYDQINKDNAVASESANLRLVKRGKETHGPDGTMSVVRAQVVFMEPLKEESKVLKAILDYEK